MRGLNFWAVLLLLRASAGREIFKFTLQELLSSISEIQSDRAQEHKMRSSSRDNVYKLVSNFTMMETAPRVTTTRYIAV